MARPLPVDEEARRTLEEAECIALGSSDIGIERRHVAVLFEALQRARVRAEEAELAVRAALEGREARVRQVGGEG